MNRKRQPSLPSDPEALLSPWWEPVALEVGQCWRYSVGPLTLYLQRGADMWMLGSDPHPEGSAERALVSRTISALPDNVVFTRYVFNTAPTGFKLAPRLLDRPVVVRTSQPVNVPPDESITFYISSPVCVCVELLQPDFFLQEFQTVRLSDTWFGPSTQVGELCYAATTHARNSREELPLRAHRAVTPVIIHNRSHSMLGIEKLSIPLPYLSIYGSANGSLWTDPVSLDHVDGADLATLKISKDLPAGLTVADRLAVARTPLQKGGLVRVFASMFAG